MDGFTREKKTDFLSDLNTHETFMGNYFILFILGFFFIHSLMMV